MKKITIILIAVLVILVIVGGISAVLYMKGSEKQGTATTTDPFGQNGLNGGQNTATTSNNLIIKTRAGDALSVPDFRAGHPSMKETSGTYYYLTQNMDSDEIYPDFSIVYGSDSSISIGIFEEPIGASRRHAEQVLKTFLPLTNAQLCALDVTVIAPASVSETYAAENLGLSFCPGSKKLP